MRWEKWNFTPKLIKVDNYMILENMVSILEGLFRNYGDFLGKSRLISRKAKMLYKMTVCDAMQSICSTNVKDITTNLLVSWIDSFMLCQCAGFNMQFAFDGLARVVPAHCALQANVSADPNLFELDDKITKQREAVDSKEIAALKQDGETDKL